MRLMPRSALYAASKMLAIEGSGWSARVCATHLSATKPGSERCFLLLHGNPSNLGDFIETIPVLRELGQVVVFDQPGFGRSPPLEDATPNLDTFAAVAVAVAREHDWNRFDLVGQSHGGLVAHTVAARFPETVRSLVLLGTGGTPAHLSYRLLPLPGVETLMSGAGLVLGAGPLRPLVRVVTRLSARSLFAPDPVPEGFVEAEVETLVARPRILQTTSRVTKGHPCQQVAEQAPMILAPSLFIHGREDSLVPLAHARRLFELTGGDRRFEAVEGGHMVHLACPERVNPLLARWFEDL